MFHQQVRQLCSRLAGHGLMLAVLLGWASAAKAQTPAEILYRDLRQTVQAHKLLLDDPRLGPLNLGVKVSNHTAVLWGPVPSQELAARAEQRLRTMFELAEIHNRLTIEPDEAGAPLTPELQRVLPEHLPPDVPQEPRRLLPQPAAGVALAGIVTPDEMLTARSSPLSGAAQAGAGPAALHLHFLGSIVFPR